MIKTVFATLLVVFSLLSSHSYSEPQHGFSPFGELKYTKEAKSYDYVDPNAPKGGEVTMGMLGTFDSLNSFIVRGTSAAGVGFTIATLMSSPADEVSSNYGYIAESVEVDPNGAWVIFHINQQAKFNDGASITADDVVFSFNTLKEKGSPGYRSYYKLVASVEKIDTHTVKFIFSNDKVKELPLILGQLPVLQKKYFDDHKFEETTLIPFPSAGPYEVESLDPGRSITLRRVKGWWGENLLTHKGHNNFDRINIIYFRDTNALFEAFKSGQIDVRSENISKMWATSYDFPAVRNGSVKMQVIPHKLPGGSYGLFFNMRRPIFQDRLVRKALTFAFNFEWLNKNIFYSLYRRSLSFFPKSDLAASGMPEGRELEILEKYKDKMPEEVLTKEYTLPVNGDQSDTRAVLSQCLDLLKQAGWEVKDQKLVNVKTGEPFKFEILNREKSTSRIMLHYKETLTQLGIEVKVRSVDSNSYQQRLDKHDYDMILGVIGQGLTPGNEQRVYWSSQGADQEGSRNFAGLKSEAVDGIISDLVSSQTYEELSAATHALDRALLWQFIMIPAWHSTGDRLAYWDRFNLPLKHPEFTTYGYFTPPMVLAWSFNSEKDAKLRGISAKKEEAKPQEVEKMEEKGMFESLLDWVRSLVA